MRRVALAGLLAVVLGAQPATAQESPVVGHSEQVGGLDLAHWQIAWNRWYFKFTRTQARRAKDCLPQAGAGPVRFLEPGPHDEHVFEVHCAVAAGTYLMLGQPEIFCTDAVRNPGFDDTARGLGRCVRNYWPRYTDPHPRVVLDGTAIGPGPVVHTGLFGFTMPARDNVLYRPGVRRARMSAIGRTTILRPLAPGQHTLIFGYRYHGYHNIVVVYKLTVG